MTRQLFVACGNKILEFDVRNTSGVVSVMESESDSVSTVINDMCIDPEGYILGSCNSAGNIDIYNVYTRETKRIMNLDRTVSTLSFYRQGKNVSLFATGDLTTVYNYSMTGELLHQSTLPVLPDIEASDIETPVVKDICMNYDGRRDRSVRCRFHAVRWLPRWISPLH
ncbi:uncharacterized protein [Blastocystis hominis]|uniref:Uncharacterized protein n=1 Tax=Blastocystis hominis TaxID=12968 RepID=D8M740_BLAHO|nr:uncharacterized protein [Blastocystis hominis]CBK23879.2 unnamed protein product [Blastocystis hominis]|eukprot:XP_012897927.1 uncharacterized protein [Blastocystis hominis]